MEDELLSDILAVERDIRLQIDTLEQQIAARLAALERDLVLQLESEIAALQADLAQAETRAVQEATDSAEALMVEARDYVQRMENLDTRELERVVLSHLVRILPEGEP